MNFELLLEAERRGILPPDKAALLAEARRRGLVEGDAPAASEPRMGQRVREFFLGDDDPTTQNLGERIGTVLNKAGEAATFGLIGDEASGAVAGMIPGGMNAAERRDYERQQEAILERDNPGLALGAEIGGSLAGALLPGGTAATLARGASLPARVGASAAAGAGMGGTYGFMEGEGADDRLAQGRLGATVGGVVGAAVPAVGGAIQKAGDARAASRAIRQGAANAPTSEQLRSMGTAAYREIDDAGVQIRPQSFENARQRIVDALRDRTSFDELPGPGSLTPNTARVAQIMQEASGRMSKEPTAALPFRSLDQMRRQAGAAAGNVANKADSQAGMTVIDGMDDFVRSLGADDVVAGDVKALQDAIPKARDIWARMSRSQVLDDAIEQQDNYLSGGASAIRNRFATILRNEKLSRGFSEAEKKAMQRVVSGSIPQQIVNYLGSGLGMMAQMGTGAALGGPAGFLGGMGLAAGSRKAAEAMTRRNAEIARALVANGGLEKLPVASDQTRRIAESLMRRTAAAGPQ